MEAFTNRTTLITGAGSGLGRQLALTLSAEGAAIAAVDIQAEALEKLSAEMQSRPMAWAAADVTDRNALRGAVLDLENQLGPIDLLIASAGIGLETTAYAFRAEELEAQVRVNLVGVANAFEAVLPGMLKRRRGHLAAISSLASYRGLPRMAGYCASKAGLNALLDAFRIELEPCGIHVTTICPGWVRTPMTAAIRVPASQLMEVEAAAREIAEAIRRRRRFHAFPGSAARRLQLLRWLPTAVADWLTVRAMRRLGLR